MKKTLVSLAVSLSVCGVSAHPIDFDRITNWTGTGPNRAALVIQFNGDTYGPDAYVWGYRWENGVRPTGETMMKAICEHSSRLSMLTQYTGSMGSTLCGVGYSMNQDLLKHIFFNFDKAKEFEFINFDYYNPSSFMGQKEAPGDNAPTMAQQAIDLAIAGSHYIQHPFDYKTYGYPAYDYDCWDLDEQTEMKGGMSEYEPKWLSAWYEGYWSYWCANAPSQDWIYSGSGFTGRQLSDGAVDGWSFTQFESAMVGGMGEGVAPCEDGAIIYMPASLTGGRIDIDGCKRTIGSGDCMLPLIVQFGNPAKIDNVVMALRFNSELPTAAAVMNLLSADPAFGLDGNTLSIDADGDGVFNNAGSDACATGQWTLTEFEDCLVLACGEVADPAYLLYLPEAGVTSATIPAELTFALSDEANFIPVFVQRDATYDAINYTWYRRTDATQSTSSNSSDIVSSVATAAATFGQLTYTGTKAGDLYLSVRARTGKGASYSYSNVCHFTLLPPEIPIESIRFEEPVVESPLNATVVNLLTILPENATFTRITYKSSDTKVATASASAIKTTKVAGSAEITVSSTWDQQVSGSFEIVSALRHPVTDFSIDDVDGDVIVLNPKQMIGIIAKPVPADADIPDFNVTLTGNGTSRDNYIATMYKVNYWDENNTRIQFNELNGHRAGECTLTLTSTDGGNVSKTYRVIVKEQDRTPLAEGYTDGTLLLNEEWFGHTNGGLNYLTPEGEMMYQVYERENPGMSLGCTSQYAAIWADKLIAVSKQAADGGDPLPGGGRIVVADAKTLKRIGSIDDLMFGSETKSADGRAVVGATPQKAYIGTSNGIYILDLDQVAVTGKITAFDSEGAGAADLYSGQIGDMVHAGRYVFGIKQATGAFAIDVETDQVVKTYPFTTVQGITQSADGNVWVASVVDGCGRFTCIDPVTLEENEQMSVTFPAEVSYPTCPWGAWRNTPFIGSHSRNTIWFSTGAGIAGGSSKDKYYGWEVGSDPAAITPIFDLGQANLTGSHPNVKQKTYGTLRYDERSGELIVMTTEDSASGHYRYNWTHFIDPETGEIKRTIALRPYYWFQAFAIFPDKHDPVINLGDITLDKSDPDRVIDLTDYITDADNVDSNIRLSLVSFPAPMAMAPEEGAVAEVSLDGRMLTISPKDAGSHQFTLAAESNGRTVSKTVTLNVGDIANGIDQVATGARAVWCDGHRLYINGCAGEDFGIFDVAGRQIATLSVDTDSYVFDFGRHTGVFIVTSADSGLTTKVILR